LGKQARIKSALIQTGSAFTMKAKPYPRFFNMHGMWRF